MSASRLPRIYLPCSGLGRVKRGFEAFARECAEALGARSEIDLTVFGGGGDVREGEREVWNLSRRGMAARTIGRVLDRDPYFVEQLSFFAGFLPALIAQPPDVIYFADLNLGNACWHWRRWMGHRYRLVFYNGGPTTQPFTRCDLVQQVSPEHLHSALTRGERADRQLLLPHALTIEKPYRPPTREERATTRLSLGLPLDAKVVISVGALNASHKRMHYVIDEVATMASAPHLLLLGSAGEETPAIRERAANRLPRRCTMLTLPREQVLQAYRAADVFVLASLIEGFGIAQVEALDAGLPCVAHATPTSAFVLGPHGITADLRMGGVLAPLLERALSEGPAAAEARHAHAYESFSWDALAPRYIEMLTTVAQGRTSTPGER
jgi:1,2-diacylglycerol 3-alpha-glucosyltransferase